MGWFNVLMTEFIVAYVHGRLLFLPNPHPFFASSLSPTPFDACYAAKFIVVSGRKDGVDLVLIYRYLVIFVARFG